MYLLDDAAADEAERPFEETTYYRFFCVVILFWFFAFMYPVVSITSVVSNIKTANDSVTQGSIYNQFMIGCFALLGAANGTHAIRNLKSPQSKRLLFLLGCYFSWSLLSISWSTDVGLSIRRLVTLFLLLIGSVGLGAGFYARTRNGISVLAKHVTYAACLCSMWLLIRLATGAQDMTNPEWTMKYSFQIEPYAYALGYGMVAAFYLFRGYPLKRAALVGLYLLLLIALKGRTLLLGVFAASGIVYSKLSDTRIPRLLVMSASCFALAILLDLVTGGNVLVVAVTSGYDLLAPWLPYISIGDGLRNLTELSGRTPLWNALWPHAAQHLFLGHGFGSFWNPDRFAEIYASVRWHAVVAHNGFLDEILATGIIGLTLLMAFWGYGMFLAWRRGAAGYVVFGWLLLFLCFNTMLSIIQAYFQLPMFVSIAAMVLISIEYSFERCDDCGAKLLAAETEQGEFVSVHP